MFNFFWKNAHNGEKNVVQKCINKYRILLSSVMSYTLGIDLGTRYSCVSIWRKNKFEIIPDGFGNRTMPSVVSYYRSAKLVGSNASKLKEANPLNTIYDAKRIIGRSFDDPYVSQFQENIPYKISRPRGKNNIIVKLDNDGTINQKTSYTLEEICASILIELRKSAEKYLKKDVRRAVITVPAYFNDSQRQSTLDAANIAGLQVVKMINEPTAAALAYGIGSKIWPKKTGGNVIVYDFGAGTLDVSLMNIHKGTFQTIAVSGNTKLGGEDIDNILVNKLLVEFSRDKKLYDICPSKISMIKLKRAVENAKILLSTFKNAMIKVDNFYEGIDLVKIMTRDYLETSCNQLFSMAINPIQDVLESSKMSKDDIDCFILVGGSSKIPKIKDLILTYFSGTKIKCLTSSLSPDEVVSAGASIYGYIVTNNKDPFSENIVLLDVTPLSLGVEVMRSKMAVVIPRNTIIPTKKTMKFTTDTDYQTSVNIKIFEGERRMTDKNLHLGTFELSGFESGPSGYPSIKITFHVDVNGILQVTATEKNSNVRNSINITSTWGAKGRLSNDEISKMIVEAQDNDHIDNIYSIKTTLLYKIRYATTSIINNIKKNKNITKKDIAVIKKDINKTIKWINSIDFDAVRIDKLKETLNKISSLYVPMVSNIDKQDGIDVKSYAANTRLNADDIEDNEDNENNSCEYGFENYCEIEKNEIDDKIDSLKNTISSICKNITSIVCSPVSKFDKIDVEKMIDYITTVNIWLYTNTSTVAIDYHAKIDEINTYTEIMLSKYHDKEIFGCSETFSAKDELVITCNALKNSVNSNFIAVEKTKMAKLIKTIDDTILWLNKNIERNAQDYQNKLDIISKLSNDIHDSTQTVTTLINDSDSSDDSIKNNRSAIFIPITEDLDSLMGESTSSDNNDSEILVKIDIEKLEPCEIKYEKRKCAQ